MMGVDRPLHFFRAFAAVGGNRSAAERLIKSSIVRLHMQAARQRLPTFEFSPAEVAPLMCASAASEPATSETAVARPTVTDTFMGYPLLLARDTA
ncbi:hypothetical protein BSZ19_14330 [Bradyrhizobium japonicum]|uniref:Uncharacterized protein n=1 Tax=Bradyrhizobium japonicum TaxID=375 RepID=A0A1Y2JSI3_BRAJP|nr:hypothetical protein [Bradyrhizobium japonicum]OSJ33787.1 hypothetical protein BSZ19_14330 [Bradyrhizobium japonicum]